MSANQLIRELTIPEKAALLRVFVTAAEAGLVDADELLTVDQKASMKELFPVVEKYWSGA